MLWEVVFNPEEEFVHLTIEGSHQLEDIREMCVELFSVAKVEETWRLLIDTRASTAQLSTLDIYKMPKLFQSLGLRRNSRVALLFSGASVQKTTFSFVRTVSRNQGFNIALFTEAEEAIRWLQVG